jgi:hypothetical protein
MGETRNPGRVAGLWYLLLVVMAPLSLIYIPSKLFVFDNPALTVSNIAGHVMLFRVGMLDDLLCGVVLIFLVLAFYRLFKGVDKNLALQVAILGGIMPALIDFVNVVNEAGALLIVRNANILAAFDQPQRDGVVVLLLKMHNAQNTAAELLWGLWLFPLAILVYRSKFLPRFLGVWLGLNGVAYVVLCLIGLMLPQYAGRDFWIAQPALFGELALMLWLVVRGARPGNPDSSMAAV